MRVDVSVFTQLYNPIIPWSHARMLHSDLIFQSCPMKINHSIVASHQTFITCDKEEDIYLVLYIEELITPTKRIPLSILGLDHYFRQILFVTLDLYMYMLVQ